MGVYLSRSAALQNQPYTNIDCGGCGGQFLCRLQMGVYLSITGTTHIGLALRIHHARTSTECPCASRSWDRTSCRAFVRSPAGTHAHWPQKPTPKKCPRSREWPGTCLEAKVGQAGGQRRFRLATARGLQHFMDRIRRQFDDQQTTI